MDVQYHVAVVGRNTVAPYRLSAEFDELARNVDPSHRYDLDRQRKAAKYLDQLGVVDDADEPRGRGGDHLFPREGGSPTLDQDAVGGGLIGAVDIQGKVAGGIEIEFRDSRGPQSFRGLARTRNCSGKLYFMVFQRFYELIHRGPGAYAQHHAGFDEAQRGFCCKTFLFQ